MFSKCSQSGREYFTCVSVSPTCLLEAVAMTSVETSPKKCYFIYPKCSISNKHCMWLLTTKKLPSKHIKVWRLVSAVRNSLTWVTNEACSVQGCLPVDDITDCSVDDGRPRPFILRRWVTFPHILQALI